MSSHWQRHSPLSPDREYSPVGSAGSWNGLDYGTDRAGTSSGFREDLVDFDSLSRRDDSPDRFGSPRIHYEDTYSPIGSDPTDFYIPSAEFQFGGTSEDQIAWYREEDYEADPDFLQGGCSELETLEDWHCWRFEERSDALSTRSHSGSPVDFRSSGSYSQSRDWVPAQDHIVTRDTGSLYKEKRHDSGRERSPTLRKTSPPLKTQRSSATHDRGYSDCRSRTAEKLSPGSSRSSDGGRSEPGRKHSRATYIRGSSPDRQERVVQFIRRGERGRSPTREGHLSVRSTRTGDDVDMYRSRYDNKSSRYDSRRKEGSDDDLRSIGVHHRSLSPRSDTFKRDAPSGRGGYHPHHRSLSPRDEYPAVALAKDRDQAGDLRELLLKRGRDRSVEKLPTSGWDKRRQPKLSVSISNEREFTRGSCGHLPGRRQQTSPLSDDFSSSRRTQKGHQKDRGESRKQRSRDGKGNLSPRNKSRSADGYGSGENRAGRHRKSGNKQPGAHLEKDKNALGYARDSASTGSRRGARQHDCGGKKNQPEAENHGRVSTGTATQESSAPLIQPVIHLGVNSASESPPHVDGASAALALAASTGAVSYGYTATMRKRSAVADANPAQASYAMPRDPRLRTAANPGSEHAPASLATNFSAAVSNERESAAFSTAPGSRPINAGCSHQAAGEGGGRDAVTPPDPEPAADLPFGYRKTWNGDGQKQHVTRQAANDRETWNGDGQKQHVTRQPANDRETWNGDGQKQHVTRQPANDRETWNEDGQKQHVARQPANDRETWDGDGQKQHLTSQSANDRTATHESALGGEGLERDPAKGMGLQGPVGQRLVPTPAGRVTSDPYQRYSPSSPTTDCEGQGRESMGRVIGGSVPRPVFDAAKDPAEVDRARVWRDMGTSDLSSSEVGGDDAQREHRARVVYVSGVKKGRQAEQSKGPADEPNCFMGMQGTTGTGRSRIQNIRRKKHELEEVYREECAMFVQVAKMLVREDPSLEQQMAQSVRANLLAMGQRCVQELERFARMETSKDSRASSEWSSEHDASTD